MKWVAGDRIMEIWAHAWRDELCVALAEMLKINTTLTNLQLLGGRNSGASDAGGAALGNALKTNTALASLRLEFHRYS